MTLQKRILKEVLKVWGVLLILGVVAVLVDGLLYGLSMEHLKNVTPNFLALYIGFSVIFSCGIALAMYMRRKKWSEEDNDE